MIDRTRWGIIQIGALTASGYPEIQVRTIRKQDCLDILKTRYGSLGKARRHGLKIARVAD